MDEPTIVIGQRYNSKGTKRSDARTGSQETEIKGKSNKRPGTDHQRLAKIDRENEVAPPSKIDPAVGRVIQASRLKLGWGRDVLAQKIDEKSTLVGDYEGGRAIPNNAILAKMERQLKVKLRGTDIGKPLEGKKKKGESSKAAKSAEDKAAEDKDEEGKDKNEEGKVDEVEKPESTEPAEASGSGKTKNKKKS